MTEDCKGNANVYGNPIFLFPNPVENPAVRYPYFGIIIYLNR